MSNNRTRSMAAAKKGTAARPARNGPSQAASSNTRKQPGGNAVPTKSAASRRFAERQALKEQVALEARRVRNRRYAIFTIALVVCIVAVLVVVKVAGNSGNGVVDQTSPPAGTPIPATTLAKLSSVPVSTLNAAPISGIINAPQTVPNPALNSGGKPELLYIGAEWCPHCAAERWALYVALSKFGTFSPAPGRIHSANRDGNVPTLTFYGTKYSSPYLSFDPVEVFTNHPSGNGYTALQTPTPSQLRVWQANGGTFPFVDLGGKQVLSGAQYSFADLQNLPFSTVATRVGDNSTAIGSSIDASAAQLIKTICGSLTHGQPADVCSP
jgi:hypothetical protein